MSSVNLPTAREIKSGWEFRGLRDSTLFFRTAHLVLPPDSFLVLEEESMAKDVREFVEANDAAALARLSPGTLWPRSRMHWIAAGPRTLAGLAGLSSHHAEPEICSHLYGVHVGRIILDWHDAFDGPLVVSSALSPEALADFGCAVGIQPKPWQLS